MDFWCASNESKNRRVSMKGVRVGATVDCGIRLAIGGDSVGGTVLSDDDAAGMGPYVYDSVGVFVGDGIGDSVDDQISLDLVD